jgi:hypothetical protein
MSNYQDQINEIESRLKQPTGKVQRPQVPQRPKPPTDRHDRTAQQSTSESQGAIATITNDQKATLANVKSYIVRTQSNRDTAIEQASDAIAYLHDPAIFESEVFARAAQKIQAASVSVSFEDLGNAYSDFDVSYPAIAPHSIAGCLPM